jgi:hypothetical protein
LIIQNPLIFVSNGLSQETLVKKLPVLVPLNRDLDRHLLEIDSKVLLKEKVGGKAPQIKEQWAVYRCYRSTDLCLKGNL